MFTKLHGTILKKMTWKEKKNNSLTEWDAFQRQSSLFHYFCAVKTTIPTIPRGGTAGVSTSGSSQIECVLCCWRELGVFTLFYFLCKCRNDVDREIFETLHDTRDRPPSPRDSVWRLWGVNVCKFDHKSDHHKQTLSSAWLISASSVSDDTLSHTCKMRSTIWCATHQFQYNTIVPSLYS